MLDYPNVCAWLNREGALLPLLRANVTRLTADEATALARRILGPQTIVRVKRVGRSHAYYHNESVTLRCDDRRTVTLDQVLHEAAHILDYRKGPKMGHSHHGEPFRRTYKRLLMEYAQ